MEQATDPVNIRVLDQISFWIFYDLNFNIDELNSLAVWSNNFLGCYVSAVWRQYLTKMNSLARK